MKKSGIYEIINTTNGHRYIGSAVDIRRRWVEHRQDLVAGTHHSKYLQRSWSKNGEVSFHFGIIEECTPEDLLLKEQHWLDMLSPEYNTYRVAGSPLGFRHTPETRARMSVAQIGNQNSLGYKHSDEHRRKNAAAMMGNKYALGGKHTPAQNAAKSAALMGNQRCLGHRPTLAARARMSVAQRGRTITPEHRAKISATMMGRKFTPEHRAKLSAAMVARFKRPEARAKISATLRARTE